MERRVLLSGYVPWASAAAAAANELTMRAPADAYVRDGAYAGRNFSTGVTLEAKKVSAVGYSRESYLKFDLSGVGQASGINAATVRLFGRLLDAKAPSMTVGLYPVASTAWTEPGLTWNTRPSAATTAVATKKVTGTTSAWYDFDVTAHVKQQKAAGATAVALAVKATAAGQGWAGFASDEAVIGQPLLAVAQGDVEPPPPQGLIVSTNNLTVPEGLSASFTGHLATAPAADVVVTVSKSPAGDPDLNAAATSLTFTPANWDKPQAVTITAAQDPDQVIGTAQFNVSSPGLATQVVQAAEQDDDTGSTTTVTLRPPADGYVRDGSYAGQNFGAGGVLEVKRVTAPGYSRESYLRFDLTGVADAAAITSAKVRLFGKMLNTAAPNVAVSLFPVASTTWTESSLTWTSRPAAGATAIGTKTVSGTGGTWYEYDVTAYLKQQKLAGATAVALAIKAPNAVEGWAGFNSDEASANGPQLVVVQMTATAAPTLARLTLVNAATDHDIGPLTEGQTIDLKAASQLNVRADPASGVASVVFRLDGFDVRTESSTPYTLAGDNAGDYLPWTPTVGPHTLTVTPWSSAGGTGTVGQPITVHFTVVDTTNQVPATLTLRPPADGYVRDGTYAGQGFGQVAVLEVKKVAALGYTRESYLRFDLAGVASADRITSATVRAFGKMLDTKVASMSIGLYPVTNTGWAETALTWNNRPAAGSTAQAIRTVAGTGGAWYEFDVTAYVKQQKAAGATGVAFALMGTAAVDAWAGFNSDEAAVNGPQLVVAQAADTRTLDEKAADALAFARQQAQRTLTDLNGATTKWPHTTNDDGTWHTEPRQTWTSGFFPGILWQLYRQTGDTFWKTKATASAMGLKGNETMSEDNEFRTFIPFQPLYDETGDDQYRDILLTSAASKSATFNKTVGAFQTGWRNSTSGDPRANFGVLMDQMMDLELMFWAAKQSGNQEYYDRSVSNARTVARNLIRSSSLGGGSYHWGYFDSATGEFISGETAQGYSNDSTWSRGQAWGIYAFAMVYRETGDAEFLDAARTMADYFISNLPADHIPFWDFNDPAIPNTYKDSSAAAIAASGLFELAKLDPANAAKYGGAARDMLGALATAPYLAQGTTSHAILNGGAWYVPSPYNSGESSTVWGDYYFLEAINRYADGWTVLAPADDSRTIYVDNTPGGPGKDTNDGRSPDKAVLSWSKGVSLLRNGYPDQILVKRGTTHNLAVTQWSLSGRSPAEPLVIGSYGDPAAPRPRFVTGTSAYGFSTVTNEARLDAGFRVRNVVLSGLEFTPGVADTTTLEMKGLVSLGGLENFLVEDCIFRLYQDNVALDAALAPISNVRIRRSVIADAYGAGSSVPGQEFDERSQGMYANGVNGLLLEENLFDHNGWNESVAGAGPNLYSQGVYLNTLNAGVIVRDNIFARTSGHALQARAGGLVRDNLFLSNPFDVSFGYAKTSAIREGGVTGQITGNVIVGARDVPWDDGEWVMDIANITPGAGVAIRNNLMIGDTRGDKPAIRLRASDDPKNPSQDVGLNDVTVERNTVYGWSHAVSTDERLVPGGVGRFALNHLVVRNNDFQRTLFTPIVSHGNVYAASAETWSGNRYDTVDTSSTDGWFAVSLYQTPQALAQWQQSIEPTARAVRLAYADPSRTAGTYNATLSGSATLQGFLAAARQQSKANWRPEYAAGEVIDYLQAGFATA